LDWYTGPSAKAFGKEVPSRIQHTKKYYESFVGFGPESSLSEFSYSCRCPACAGQCTGTNGLGDGAFVKKLIVVLQREVARIGVASDAFGES
jgi:hypothetical protein